MLNKQNRERPFCCYLGLVETMPFVPGHKHDLFLSYAHAEGAWVEAFRKAVCDEFQVRAGVPVTVWHDSQNLRVGHKWASEIEEGIRNAAAFLAIVSPSYLNSPWCKQERAIALEKEGTAIPNKIAKTAIVTINSTSVKPRE